MIRIKKYIDVIIKKKSLTFIDLIILMESGERYFCCFLFIIY